MKEAPGDALVAALRAELKEAETADRPVNIGAARRFDGRTGDPRAMGARSPSTSRWSASPRGPRPTPCRRARAGIQVIGALDPFGLSPKVMQSNADFEVASTFSVNAHGWPMPFGPMGSTVRSVRMVLADGSLVSALRSENAEVFAAAMGGYGLIGLITRSWRSRRCRTPSLRRRSGPFLPRTSPMRRGHRQRRGADGLWKAQHRPRRVL